MIIHQKTFFVFFSWISCLISFFLIFICVFSPVSNVCLQEETLKINLALEQGYRGREEVGVRLKLTERLHNHFHE